MKESLDLIFKEKFKSVIGFKGVYNAISAVSPASMDTSISGLVSEPVAWKYNHGNL